MINIDGNYRDYLGNLLPSGNIPDAHTGLDWLPEVFIKRPNH